MGVDSQTAFVRDDATVSALSTPVASQPRQAMLQSLFREDRFFLILSVFIGIFSGLAGQR